MEDTSPVRLRFNSLCLVIHENTGMDFLGELESLCKRYAGEAYYFTYELQK